MRILTRRGPALVTLVAAWALGASQPAWAQGLPSEPIVVGGGWLTIGGDVSATFSCAETAAEGACAGDAGFFNYTDYEHSALRMLRVDVSAAVRATDRISVLGEVRSENGGRPQPYALFVRVKPWAGRDFDVQAGRVPPTFGAFARRTYAADNLLIGYPLAYQYLTSLRADSLPASADELLRMRGRGWLSSFSVGNTTPANGLPLVSAFRWDTGVQLHAANDRLDGAMSITTGTLSNPLVGDDNAGRQLAGRLVVRAGAGLLIGLSGARGPFLARVATRTAGLGAESGEDTQTAWGADVEYSRDYYLVRFEAIVSDWRLPAVAAPAIERPLRATSASIEGRYKIRPGLYAAARLDHLGFSEITGSARRDTWDAPVTRVEIGGGYAIQRNLIMKVSFQHNRRAGGRVARLDFGAAQLVFWF